MTVLSSLGLAATIVDKTPDLGPFWHPLSTTGTYVYTDSFVFSGTTGTLATVLGVYMHLT